jgi:hypothetical protein
MAERRYYTDNNWQEARGDDAAPRIQLADGRWIDATEVLQGDVFAKGETERAFQDRMFGGGSPNIAQGAATYMQANGLTPQQYQQQTQSLPIGFNADGTTTLDMGQRQNTLRYENPDDGNVFSKYIGPALLGGAFSAGLTGMLPGWTGPSPLSQLASSLNISNPFSGLSNFLPGATEAASATGNMAGNLPSNYWSMMAEGAGTMSDAAPAWAGMGEAASAFPTFGEAASPWLGEAGFGAPGTNFASALSGTTPSMALPGVGNLSAGQIAQVMGTAGTSGVIPSFFGQFIDGAGKMISGGVDLANSNSGLLSGLGTAANLLSQNGQQEPRTNAEYLSQLLGGAMSPQGLNMLGGGLGAALGAYGANQQANSSEKLYDKFIGLGAPYRDQLNNLSQNPDSFYKSPVFQGALQQGSDAMARSLSAKVGNPILNPTALQEMQNYTTRGSLDAYNNQFRNLMSAGQIGLGQSAQLGTNAANAQGGMADALGYGLSSVFNNRRDPYEQMAEAMRSRSPIGQSYLGGY